MVLEDEIAEWLERLALNAKVANSPGFDSPTQLILRDSR